MSDLTIEDFSKDDLEIASNLVGFIANKFASELNSEQLEFLAYTQQYLSLRAEEVN